MPRGCCERSAQVIGQLGAEASDHRRQIGDPAGTRVALVVGVIHGDERAGLRDHPRDQATSIPGSELRWQGDATLGDRDG